MGNQITIILLLLVIGLILGLWLSHSISSRKKKTRISLSYIQSRLSEASDLTTCNLEYVGLIKYASGSIPLMTKKSFSMIYKANVRAGIDLSQAKVSQNGSEIHVSLPASEIQSIDVDTDSLKFYDEHSALFNWDKKEDISIAVKAAREDVEKNASLDSLKSKADAQAQAVIVQLIEPLVGPDQKLIIEHQKNTIVPDGQQEQLELDPELLQRQDSEAVQQQEKSQQ